MLEHIDGPWLVMVTRPNELGHTVFHVATHIETAIALDKSYWPDECDWPEGYEPPLDFYGYRQPDEHADIADNKVATARLIAAAPDLLEGLRAMVGVIEQFPDIAADPQIAGCMKLANAALDKAKVVAP